MIELQQISKTYRAKDGTPIELLRDVSLRVTPGTFAAICGPSGCGKSTLLLIVGSLLHPDSGRVLVDGENFTALRGDRRAVRRTHTIGFVFQRFHLLRYLTVRENILAATIALRSPLEGAEQRADELMDRLGLAHRADHVPGRLSVGEMQRTALARALFNRPKVILADEPTGNLDPDNAEIVLDSLTDFATAGGTVMMVTHSPDAAARAQSIWQVRDGRLAANTGA